MPVTLTVVGSGDSFGSGGRFNTCFLVDAPGTRFAIDFGASSLVALNALGIAHNSIDTILLTHLHGDHCAGVPQMLVDAMLGAKRRTPLTVAGPVETQQRLADVQVALLPGSHVMQPKFDYTVLEIPVLRETRIGDLKVTTYPALHTPETNPTSMRVEVAGKVIAYTGDSAWTEHIPDLARGADLFISECYFFGKAVPFHMNYPDLRAHRKEIEARRILLTHMSAEMLAQAKSVPEECARDGMVIAL